MLDVFDASQNPIKRLFPQRLIAFTGLMVSDESDHIRVEHHAPRGLKVASAAFTMEILVG